MLFKRTSPSVIPGYKLTLGYTLFYLSAIALIPLSMLIVNGLTMSLASFIKTVTDPRIVAAYKISFSISFLAALINVLAGFVIAWVLVKYNFFGKRFFEGIIEVPFTFPTPVAGLALTALYSENGWIGSILAKIGIKVAFTPLGIMLALMFVSLPFAVRTLEPIIKDLDREIEEAAMSLGASRFQTFVRIILPSIYPGLFTAFTMGFARSLGEYGSVIFIAGNIPYVSEIIPLTIVIKLEQFDYDGATAISLTMMIVSFILLLTIKLLKTMYMKKFGK